MKRYRVHVKGPMPAGEFVVQPGMRQTPDAAARENLFDWAQQVQLAIYDEPDNAPRGPEYFVVKTRDGQYVGPLGLTQKLEQAIRFTDRMGALAQIQQIGASMDGAAIVPYWTEAAAGIIREAGSPSDV